MGEFKAKRLNLLLLFGSGLGRQFQPGLALEMLFDDLQIIADGTDFFPLGIAELARSQLTFGLHQQLGNIYFIKVQIVREGDMGRKFGFFNGHFLGNQVQDAGSLFLFDVLCFVHKRTFKPSRGPENRLTPPGSLRQAVGSRMDCRKAASSLGTITHFQLDRGLGLLNSCKILSARRGVGRPTRRQHARDALQIVPDLNLLPAGQMRH